MGGVLLGRDYELQVLGRSLREAACGQGGVVLISGEPGSGKSRLLDEAQVRAEAGGFLVLRARCAPQPLPGVDSPWVRVVRGLAAMADPGQVAPHWRIECPMFAGPGASPGAGALSLDKCLQCFLPARGDGSPRFHSLWELFAIVSRARPLIVIMDDLHNADQPTLELLRLASHALHDTRVVVAAAFRACGMAQRCWTGALVESRNLHARRVELAGLEPAATGQLLNQVVGERWAGSVIRRIHDLTGGNPGLVLETAYSCLEQAGSNGLKPLGVRVPGAVRTAVEERLAPLSPDARRLLGLASVIGESFETQTVAELGQIGSEPALRALAELEGAGLIGSVSERGYRFANGFVRRVLYEQFPARPRAALHKQLASALEAGRRGNHQTHGAEIAAHLLASRDPERAQQAVEYAEAGAREHARARDFDQAAALYCTALAALDLCAAPDEARRCDILIALGDAQTRAGDLCAAQQTLAHAAEVAQRLDDAWRLAEIVLAAPPLDGPLASSPNELVITLAENVLGSLPEGEVTQRALVMARLAAELSHLHDQRERSGQLAARALEMVKDCAGNQPTVLTVLGLRDYLLRRPELAAERLTNSAEVIAMARQRGDWAAVFAGEWAREMALLQLGEIGGADTRLQALAQAATMAGPGHQALVAALTGARAYQEGRFAEGEEWFARCRALAPGDGGPDLPDQLWPLMIMPMDERGRLAQVEPVAARRFRTHPNSTFVRAMWCWLALRLGRRSEARFHLERLAAGGFADLKCSRAVLVGAAALTEVCTELDDAPHHAAVLYELLLPHAKSNAILDINAGLGATSRYLGKLALSLSRIDEAIEHLAAAVEFNNRIGARAWAAYAAHELAVALLFRGRPQDARRALELMANAYSEAVCMGMERLAGAIKAGAARIEFGREELLVETNFPFPIADRKMPNNGVTGVLTGPPLALRPASEGAGRAPEAVDPGTPMQGPAARSSAVLRLEAEYWTAQYQGRTVRLKHLKGLALIAYLLSRPHQEVHALELAGMGDPEANGIAHRAQYPVESLDLGPVLDPAAKQTYRQRIRELHEELDEARSFNDLERAAKIEEEIRLIACELSRALGLNGRDRKTSSQVERARLRVTNAIKSAINKISNHHHELGHFLARSIRTGTFCCYVPESDSCPDWTF